MAYQHVSETPIPPSQVDPAVPPSLDPLVMKALAKDPNDRYQTAADFRADVERAMAGLPITSAIPAAVPLAAGVAAADATQRFPVAGDPADPMAGADDGEKKRSPWVWIGIAALVLLVAGLALFLGRVLFGATTAEQVSVPAVVGKTVTQAESQLAKAGLTLGTQTPQASDQPKGDILSQNPQAGTQLAKGQSVAVTVSAGRAQVQVPTLTGLASSDDAQTALNEVNLNLGNVTKQDSDQPEGMVLSQSPSSGTTVDEGSNVNITVSNGMVSIPDVVGDSEAQANATLQNAGFNVQSIDQSSSEPPGTVLAQSPSGGTKVQKGAQVTITVARALAAPEADRANDPPQSAAEDALEAPADSVTPTPTASATISTEDGIIVERPGRNRTPN